MITVNSTYFWYVFVPTMLLSLGVQWYLTHTFKKWGKVDNQAGLTGREVADELFDETSLEPVPVLRTPQPLGDHYDPKENVVRLSPPVGDEDSVSAMAVTAHELGHVEQYQEDSSLIKMRGFLIPMVRFSPIIMYVSVMLGLFFNMTNMLWVALFFFGVTVIFALLTLPVERNASKRAMSLLHEADLLKSPDEEDGARSVLRAAAMTYLAAFVTSVLQFFYYLRAVERESDEDAMREARRDAVKQSTQASARAPQRRR